MVFLIYITVIGYGMIYAAIIIGETTDEDLEIDAQNTLNLLLAGGFLSSFFWVIN